MALFANEGFNGVAGDNLSTANPAWQKVTGVTGDALISSTGDRLRFSGTTLYYLSSPVPPSENYSATVDLQIASAATAGPGAGVAVRLSSTAQTYYLVRLLVGTGIQMYRVVNGTSALLGSAAYTAVTGALLRLRLAVNGSALAAYIDDAPTAAITATDTSITGAGFVGFRTINAASQVYIDNLSADDGQAGGITTTQVRPVAATLAVTGYAPEIAQSANRSVTPGPAALAVAGYAPTITRTAHQAVSPAPAGLVLRGYAPTITQQNGSVISPAPGRLSIQGYAPSIGQSAHRTLSPGPAALAVTGYAPTITRTGPATDPRYARPAADLQATGAWAASNGGSLAAAIGEPSADASTYIRASSPGSCEIVLNPVLPPAPTASQVVRYQAWSPGANGLTVRLLQGARQIAAWTHDPAPLEPTIFARTLTAEERASITDYSDLRFQFEAF